MSRRRQSLRRRIHITLLCIVCRIFLSLLTLCNTFSFITRSVLQIFSILLQHQMSELSMYFCSTFRSVYVSAAHKIMLQIEHFSSFFLKVPVCCWKDSSCWRLLLLCNLGFNFICTSCIICYHTTQIGEALHSALYCCFWSITVFTGGWLL